MAVANAGTTVIQGALETSDTEWEHSLAVNLSGVFHTLRAAGRAMRAAGAGGSIIVTGSVCSRRAQHGLSAYTATKHGVLGLVRQLALELAPLGIRVNLLEPGNVDTPMINNEPMYRRLPPDLARPGRDDAAVAFARMNAMETPWVAAEDVSEAMLWLAGDRARFLTEIELPVDAGLLLTPGRHEG
ncbi:SDR family oxidoreductase [Pseudonocardia lutea]|uniref:SDR family oxidoreductase n=1 Tax=Pseudonocardia lutea TaxID=2172015 RepID=A0ABW1I216_9PSEU